MMNNNFKACVRLHSGEVYTGVISKPDIPDYLRLTTEAETIYLPRQDIKSVEDLESNIIFLGKRAP